MVKKVKEDVHFKNFLDTFWELHINIPLLDVLQGIPKYPKYLKVVVTNQTKLLNIEMVLLSEKCSSMEIRNMPKKLKELGSFSLPIKISDNSVVHNLSESINFMPLLVFITLRLGKLRPYFLVLQMEDMDRVELKWIINDMLIKVGNYIIHNNFIILGYDGDDRVLIILSHLLFKIGEGLVDVRDSTLKKRLDNEVVFFQVYKPLNPSFHYKDLCMINLRKWMSIMCSPNHQ